VGRKEPLLFATGYLEHFASGEPDEAPAAVLSVWSPIRGVVGTGYLFPSKIDGEYVCCHCILI
jgi:hypothetical protein